MNKIEQVARAIYETWAASGRTEVTWEEVIRMRDADGYANAKEIYLLAMAEARAAIEAMREPTEGMRASTAANWGRQKWQEYQNMIDDILNDG